MKEIDIEVRSDEVNLLTLAKTIWRKRMLVSLITLSFTICGVFIALVSENLYQAGTTFIPKGENMGSVGGNLGGLASLAGINIGATTGSGVSIPPAMYHKILKSTPFLERLFATEFSDENRKISIRDYYNQNNTISMIGVIIKYTIGLPSLIKSFFYNEKKIIENHDISDEIKYHSHEEEELFNMFKEVAAIDFDDKEGFITLTVVDKNPIMAAVIAQNAQVLLQQEIKNFKIKNAKELLLFTEVLSAEKKAEFETIQDELASFRDMHQNISSSLFQNKLNRLENDFTIASSVYQELAKQVEQARIQLRKDTPIFTVIDPVTIPNQKISPKRTQIVIGFGFFGFIIGVAFILIKIQIIELRNRIINTPL